MYGNGNVRGWGREEYPVDAFQVIFGVPPLDPPMALGGKKIHCALRWGSRYGQKGCHLPDSTTGVGRGSSLGLTSGTIAPTSLELLALLLPLSQSIGREVSSGKGVADRGPSLSFTDTPKGLFAGSDGASPWSLSLTGLLRLVVNSRMGVGW